MPGIRRGGRYAGAEPRHDRNRLSARRVAIGGLAGKPPLKPADLVTVRDPRGRFNRRFTFDATAGEYRPDRKPPNRSDYAAP
jgi:hypothetical protein